VRFDRDVETFALFNPVTSILGCYFPEKGHTVMRSRKAVSAVLALALTLFALVPALALADSSQEGVTDTAGNSFVAGQDVELTERQLSSDAFVFGQNVRVSESFVGADVFLCGQTIDLSSTSLGGSLRAAGQDLRVSGVTCVNNITAAGQTLTFDNDVIANGVYLAGQEINYAGYARYLSVSGDNVIVDGQIDGDVNIDANSVTIGSNARVTGSLSVSASSEPTVEAGAVIPDIDYTHVDNGNQQNVVNVLLLKVYWVIAFAIIALLCALLLPAALEGSAREVKEHPAPLFVTGLVALFVEVPVCILLFILYVTIPLAVIVALFLVIVGFLAVPFTGASLGRLLLQDKMKPLLASFVGGLVLALATAIPIAGFLVVLASMCYLLGYLIRTCYAYMKGKGASMPPTSPSPASPNGGAAPQYYAPYYAPQAPGNQAQWQGQVSQGMASQTPDQPLRDASPQAPVSPCPPAPSEPSAPCPPTPQAPDAQVPSAPEVPGSDSSETSKDDSSSNATHDA
jgi:hypothetical protein